MSAAAATATATATVAATLTAAASAAGPPRGVMPGSYDWLNIIQSQINYPPGPLQLCHVDAQFGNVPLNVTSADMYYQIWW